MSKDTSARTISGVAIGGNYDPDEEEFIRAMQKYMAEKKVRFPSFTEVLQVAKSLGYRKARRKGETG